MLYSKPIKTSLFTASLLIILFNLGFFSSWRTKMTDKLFLQKDSIDNIVILAIDNDSLQKIGRWPWERSVHADLINKISESNPAIIALDVIFPETSAETEDSKLAQAIKNNNVILPIEAELEIDTDKITATKLLYSIEEINNSALSSGITNTPPDADGVFRKLPIFVFYADKSIKSFAQISSEKYLEKREENIAQIPLDKKNRMIINYAGRPGTFTSISAFNVLEDNFNKELFKDKIVLIGATASDLHDEQIVPTSEGEPMSGVEIHANAINTILSHNFIEPLSSIYQSILFLCLALIISLAVVKFKTLINLIISLLVLITYFVIAFILFDKGILLDLFFAFLIVIFSYIATTVEQHIYNLKEKHKIKEAFSRYVSPDIINELLKNPDKLKLGGEKKELSILFSDIRNFTAISEKLSPEKLVELLNDYLSKMTDIIMESGGVVDKYIGDAIMSFWGAPLSDELHARHSCEAALTMIEELNKQRKIWRKNFGVEMNIGIGINSGKVIIGNMGSEKRFDYTIMGDSVNLASRLEGITKQYGVEIVISETIMAAAGDDFVYRYLDKVAVKGKTEGVKIYQLICLQKDINEDINKLINKFAVGIKHYQNQEWLQAITIFKGILKKYPKDGPSKVFLDRCQSLKDDKFEDWDGIYRLSSK